MTTFRFTNRYTGEIKDIKEINVVFAGMGLNPHQWVNTHIQRADGTWVEMRYNNYGMLCAN